MCVCECVWKSLSHIWLFATPLMVACQASLFMEFSRPEHWSGKPFPSPEALPNPGIEPRSPTLQAESLPSELPGKPYLKYKMKKNNKMLGSCDLTIYSFLSHTPTEVSVRYLCELWVIPTYFFVWSKEWLWLSQILPPGMLQIQPTNFRSMPTTQISSLIFYKSHKWRLINDLSNAK